MNTKQALLKIVKRVGTQAELARQLGVSRGNVSDWLKNRTTIPARHVKKLVRISEGEVTEKDLRPDVFYED